MRRHVFIAVAGMMALAGLAAAQRAIPPGQSAPNVTQSSVPLTGRATYERYCAGCHGARGVGDGQVAPTLKTPAANLTTLAARNGGVFPRERVRAAVANVDRPITAHSTGEMPVWGTIFRVFDRSDAEVTVRIDAVVSYVETLQLPPIASAGVGHGLFAVYCATCHGANAHGGPIGSGIRGEAPDLTMFAMRNGGSFPAERVRKIIDGREASHGPREMPVWGDAFKSVPGGGTPAEIATRIDALVKYLESIQMRLGE